MNLKAIGTEALKAVVAGGFAFFGLLATAADTKELISVTGLAVCGSIAASLGVTAYQAKRG